MRAVRLAARPSSETQRPSWRSLVRMGVFVAGHKIPYVRRRHVRRLSEEAIAIARELGLDALPFAEAEKIIRPRVERMALGGPADVARFNAQFEERRPLPKMDHAVIQAARRPPARARAPRARPVRRLAAARDGPSSSDDPEPPLAGEGTPASRARTSGLQAAQVGIVRQVEGLREILAPREYATLIDLLARWLAAELRRNEKAQERWAA